MNENRKKKRKRVKLRKDIFYTFDIETTTIITGLDEDSNPIRHGIIWSGQFYDGVNYTQVRTLRDTVDFLKNIEKRESDVVGQKICIFVHFLSYEFQFIKDFFQWENIVATSNRKIISAETKGLCFRCSNLLTNMNLRRFLEQEGVPEEFQKTNMDYLVDRYPWTEINESDYIYCKNDVVGLHMAVSNRIADCYNGDINNLPLTSTGYVRKDCRKAMAKNSSNRWRFVNDAMDLETFEMCHDAFRGGNTHANKMHANKVQSNAAGKDIASSYIFDEICWKYPTRFFDMKRTRKEFDFFRHNWKDYGLLIEVCFYNLRLKNEAATPVPYIPVSKCNPIHFDCPPDYQVKSKESKEGYPKQVDNGRLLTTGPEGYAKMIITEIDYNIIESQYTWDREVFGRVKYATKKELPKELKGQIMKYFYNKTTKKKSDPYLYGKSKNLLNSTFGMTVTYPLKPHYKFDNNTHLLVPEDCEKQELLEEFYESFASFLDYQIGVWITSYARMELQWAIDLLGNKHDPNVSDLIYCDTDSVKYLNPEEHEEDLQELNKKIMAIAEENNAYCDFDGKRYTLGIFEDDGYYPNFITYGAKKYIYGRFDEQVNDFHITISGVPKQKGHECIMKDIIRGRMKNPPPGKQLKSPFDIRKGYRFNGVKLTSIYNELEELQTYEIDGHIIEYGSNIAMYPNSYSLGLTYNYEVLLEVYKDFTE